MRKRANGEGSIYKRTDGRWAASVSLEHGKRKAFYGKTRQEVSRKLAAALKARQDGLPLVAERQTVGKYLEHWLESARPSLRPRTWLRYEQLLRLHTIPALGRVSLVKVEPQHLQRLYADRLEAGQSPASVRQLHAVSRRALGQSHPLGAGGPERRQPGDASAHCSSGHGHSLARTSPNSHGGSAW